MSVNDGLTVMEMLIVGSCIDREGATEEQILEDVAESTAAPAWEISRAIRGLYQRHELERRYDGAYEVPEW